MSEVCQECSIRELAYKRLMSDFNELMQKHNLKMVELLQVKQDYESLVTSVGECYFSSPVEQ